MTLPVLLPRIQLTFDSVSPSSSSSLYKSRYSSSTPSHNTIPSFSSSRSFFYPSRTHYCCSLLDSKLTDMMKVILKLEVHDERSKQKAMKTVSSLSGVESISMEMKDKKLTVIGDVDAVGIVQKLRKVCFTEIISVGPAKEPEKKKEDTKKEDPKKADEKKVADMVKAYEAYNYNPYMTRHYYARSVEEDPNACVIC